MVRPSVQLVEPLDCSLVTQTSSHWPTAPFLNLFDSTDFYYWTICFHATIVKCRLNHWLASEAFGLILPKSLTEQQTWKKASSRSSNLLFMDPTNPHWGWSWLERWMAARPWETKSSTANELNNDHSSVKSASPSISGSEITKAYARHQLNSDKPPSPLRQSHQSPSTPPSKALSRKLKPASPRGSLMSPDEDSRSVFSGQSERTRRHSIAGGSSVRDDESMASSPSVPSYMTPTRSAKAKARLQSPLRMENNGTPDKGSTKKRLSFPGSPARPPRRHSGPPKVDSSIVGDHGLENGAVC